MVAPTAVQKVDWLAQNWAVWTAVSLVDSLGISKVAQLAVRTVGP